jgi:hypothetical protein
MRTAGKASAATAVKSSRVHAAAAESATASASETATTTTTAARKSLIGNHRSANENQSGQNGHGIA